MDIVFWMQILQRAVSVFKLFVFTVPKCVVHMAQIYQNLVAIDEDTRVHQASSVGKFGWDYERMYGSAGRNNRFGQPILVDLLAQCHTNIYAI